MSWSKRDKDNVWHPFTHLKTAADPIVITKAEGLYLHDEKGSKIMDAISSWWVNLHGHSHPYISKKVLEQLNAFEHIPFAEFTHQPAIELAERLLKHLPGNQSKVFYSDNGSTAVEVALKMTLQYWHNQNNPKHIFIALENAYHGDTFGSMSVGARNVFTNAFENQLFHVAHVPVPTVDNLEQIKEVISDWSKNHAIAGFIFEPLIQGAAGMMMYEAGPLDELIAFCREKDIITIADEVMTGFGRTGKFFALDHLQNEPDIVCLSKGLTGGYLPLGVTSCSPLIYAAYISDDKSKTFFHGHSYTANPLACAAALASLDLMEQSSTFMHIHMIEQEHRNFMTEIKTHKACKNVRVKGTILAVELNSKEETNYLNPASENISAYFLSKGILLRPLGNVFYVLPPYCITKEELHHIYKNIREFLNL
jgi:adenosylmethionine---8-amino-7-oxononanoate aminotransferase